MEKSYEGIDLFLLQVEQVYFMSEIASFFVSCVLLRMIRDATWPSQHLAVPNKYDEFPAVLEADIILRWLILSFIDGEVVDVV